MVGNHECDIIPALFVYVKGSKQKSDEGCYTFCDVVNIKEIDNELLLI